MHEISAAEVQQLFPLCKTDDVIAGFYVEDDGRVNPVDATSALARGAKQRGAPSDDWLDRRTGRGKVTATDGQYSDAIA